MSSGERGGIGFIGLGIQGAPLARNLLGRGRELVVFDSRAEASARFATLGATVASSSAELAAACGVIFVSVATDRQLQDVLEGPNGVLVGAAPSTVVVIHSTVSPKTILALAQTAAQRQVELVDAPLTGGEAAAEARSVLFMVGGSPAAIARCLPFLEASARGVVLAGPLGAGAKVKLVHQLVMCGNLLAAREGWALGQQAGLAPEVISDAVVGGAAQSRVAEQMPDYGRGPHSAALYRKDLDHCLELARELGVELPGLGLTRRLIDDLTLGVPPKLYGAAS